MDIAKGYGLFYSLWRGELDLKERRPTAERYGR